MAFWGVEVKPGKPYILIADDLGGKLILTQATLGTVSSPKKSILQCIVGDSSPVFLCTLLPDKSECCSLNLEFDEDCDVNFSVVGPTSIHLSGFIQDHHDCDDPDCEDPDCGIQSDSSGEDIAETESDESDYDLEEEEYDFIDLKDDPTLFSRLAGPNRGVVIEEIVDDDKVTNDNGGSKQPKKKKQLTEKDKQIVLKKFTSTAVLESEDEDGFPVSSSHQGGLDSENPEADTAKGIIKDVKKKKKNDTLQQEIVKVLKVLNERLIPALKSQKGQENDVTGSLSKNKKKKGKACKTDVAADNAVAVDNKNANATSKNEQVEKLNADGEATDVGNDGDVSEGKKKKQKKKKVKKENGDEMVTEKNNTTTADKGVKQSKAKPPKVRTFPNGLVIEDLQMGKPDGKRASRGSKVSVIYIGKLQRNGKQFDSNIGRAPLKFRLGAGSVIKGWDVGLEGMRVGDKRRLTIPPSMGYGAKGASPQIPPNAWLLFDVELVSVA